MAKHTPKQEVKHANFILLPIKAIRLDFRNLNNPNTLIENYNHVTQNISIRYKKYYMISMKNINTNLNII